MIYGYARVSTNGQARDGNSLASQEATLRAAGAEKIFVEQFTGTKKHRPKLDELMSVLTYGDTLIVTKLDRIARSAKHGIDIIDNLADKGVCVNVLNMGKVDNSPTGKLMRTILLAFAEFERDMIVERTSEGKAIAKMSDDFSEGRPAIKIPDFEKFREKQKKGEMTVAECCAELGISRATWYNRIRDIA